MARVLVVDDNLELAENLRDVLERASVEDLSASGEAGARIEVVLAHDAKSGLAIAGGTGGRPVDVAIVDVRLPDASGVDLVGPLRELMPHGEVILLTGNATVESAVSAVRAGAFGFVLKSFKPGELIESVRQALSKVRLRRERERFERRYDALMNATEVLIVGLDVEGHVVFQNPKLTALLGEESLAVRFADRWVEPADRKRFVAARVAAAAGSAAIEVEVGLRDRDGAVRRVSWHLSGVREEGSDGVPDHVYGIGVDVTERRALERRATNAEALNAIAPLALGLAHEIRNPLNAAVLQLHLLKKSIDRLPEETQRAAMLRRVEVVGGEIGRLERLLTEFLELARPRAPQREPVDLARLVSDVLELEQGAMGKAGVVLSTELSPAAVVAGDTEKLKQVVLNVVVNALDAMPDGGALSVGVTGDERGATLSVSDSGKGIDQEHLVEIFDPFFTTKPAGTGLGLAIVRKIVDQHGGTVRIESALGAGTTVTLWLPSVAPATMPPPPRPAG